MSAFYEAEAFPFTERLAAAFDEVRREAAMVVDRVARLDARYPAIFRADSLLADGTRSRFFISYSGMRIGVNRRMCPVAASLLDAVPGLVSGGFYLLGAQSHIRPHRGSSKSLLRGQLGMIVPPGCTLRVADETRESAEGKFLVFDDTYEHEAHNTSDEARCVLQFDFFRPEVPPPQQEQILQSMRRRIIERLPQYGPWLHAGEVATDADLLETIEALAARSSRLDKIRAVVLEHGLYLAA